MGAQTSAPEEVPQSMSQALEARLLLSKGGCFSSTSSLQQAREAGDLPPVGDWGASPAAQGVQTGLAAALAGLPVPIRSHCLDLLAFEVMPGLTASAHVRTRLVYADAAPPEEPRVFDPRGGEVFDPLWHTPDEWTEQDDTSEPSAVVLQDLFAADKQDTESFSILLRTLVLGGITLCPHAEIKRAALGRLPAAIDPPGKQPSFNAPPCIAIAINGEWLTPVALAVLPPETREKIKAALMSQILRAHSRCIERRWAGAAAMLRHRVAPLVSVATQIDMAWLATLLALARTGGEPTVQSRSIRAHHATLLRSQGRNAEADLLEETNAQDALKYPSSAFKPAEPKVVAAKIDQPLEAALVYLGIWA